MAHRNPAAKIIHSERPSEEWWQSFSQTIFAAMQRAQSGPPGVEPPDAAVTGLMLNTVIYQGTFNNGMSKESCIRVYEHHNAQVRRLIPPERLLVFNARDGWGRFAFWASRCHRRHSPGPTRPTNSAPAPDFDRCQ